MCEQADTFCRYTLTGLVQAVHLKVRIRAGLDMMKEAEMDGRKAAFYTPARPRLGQDRNGPAFPSQALTARNSPFPTGTRLVVKPLSARTAAVKSAISCGCDVALSTTSKPPGRRTRFR